MRGTLPGQRAWQLKITLQESDPPIWRRLLVPGEVSLGELHWVIQTAMGWKNSHLHQFLVGDTAYGEPSPEAEWEIHDELAIRLSRVAPKKGSRFIYEYDFGDDWVHEIEVEVISQPEKPITHAICLDGNRACPPEDSGGMGGYEEMLRVLSNPRDEEYEDTRRWAGKGFNPDRFDPKRVNAKLKRRPRLVG